MSRPRYELEGAGKFLRNMNQLQLDVYLTMLQKGLRAGSAVVVENMRAMTPEDKGFLKRSIGRRFKTYRRTSTSIVVVGPRRKQKNLPTRYAHLTEFGTVDRYTKMGLPRGRVTPRRWMQTAMMISKGESTKEMINKIREEFGKWRVR